MSAESALAAGRAAALRLMVDTVAITRRTGETTDAETGVVTPTYAAVYTGVCKIQARNTVARPSVVGEAQVFLARLELHLPATATGVASDDLATITASVHDPDLVGRTFHVRELAHKSWLTARRFSVIEVTS